MPVVVRNCETVTIRDTCSVRLNNYKYVVKQEEEKKDGNVRRMERTRSDGRKEKK